jgi:hypothetical protein
LSSTLQQPAGHAHDARGHADPLDPQLSTFLSQQRQQQGPSGFATRQIKPAFPAPACAASPGSEGGLSGTATRAGKLETWGLLLKGMKNNGFDCGDRR